MMTPQEHLEAAIDYAIETILSENKLLKNNESELTVNTQKETCCINKRQVISHPVAQTS